MSAPPSDNALYALVAEFADSDTLLAAAHRVRETGYTRTDAFSPVPVHGLAEALGARRTILPWIVFLGGLLGCIGGFYLQYWVSVLEYPVNVGGRPMNSWPSFIPITFECTILGAGLSTIIGMLALNGLPRPYHPVFNTPGFERASDDGFFLCVESEDPQFDLVGTRAFLEGAGATQVSAVHHTPEHAPALGGAAPEESMGA